jgi:hypothetical protein
MPGLIGYSSRRNRRPEPLFERAAAVESCDAGLNMTTPPQMRELAHRLLAYEAGAGKTSEPAASTILRVYEKLRRSLDEFAGTAAFHSLASRALTMARSEVPSLRAVQVTADGALRGLGQGLGQGLSEFGPQIDLDKDRAAEHQAGDEGVALIARLLDLLVLFIGAVAMLSLLRVAWPIAAFDDRIFEIRRRA